MPALSKRTRGGKTGKVEAGTIEKVIATQAGVTFSFVGYQLNLTYAELDRLHKDSLLARNNPGKYVNDGKLLKL